MTDWREIEGFPGYTVSRDGRVKTPRGRTMLPQPNGRYGYLFVQLGRGNRRYVHRLVAAAFVASVDGMDVDHIDGDATNNHATNLRVVTHAENMRLQRERKPLCKRGHAFATFGRWATTGRRYCGECVRLREKSRVRNRTKTTTHQGE